MAPSEEMQFEPERHQQAAAAEEAERQKLEEEELEVERQRFEERQRLEELERKVEGYQQLFTAIFAHDSFSINAVQVDGVYADILDFQSDAKYFSLQQKFLESHGVTSTPAVKIRVGDEASWVPVDYGFSKVVPDLDDTYLVQQKKLDIMDRNRDKLTQYYRIKNALLKDSNLTFAGIKKDDAQSSMLKHMAHSLLTRIAALVEGQGRNEVPPGAITPPLSEVSVETEEDHQQVIYCKGYFVSTGDFFEYSNPARRAIVPGWYMFGIHTGYGPRFPPDGPLFEVPPAKHVVLRLP